MMAGRLKAEEVLGKELNHPLQKHVFEEKQVADGWHNHGRSDNPHSAEHLRTIGNPYCVEVRIVQNLLFIYSYKTVHGMCRSQGVLPMLCAFVV